MTQAGTAQDQEVLSAVQCIGVNKIWAEGTPRAHEALRDIDLEVSAGEFVVLLGPSGCGKSTLLYLVAGLEEPSAGTIASFGTTVTDPNSERSLIFQESSLFPWLSVAENVTFGLKLRGVKRDKRRNIASHYLQQVGLGEVLDRRPDELSGGMRQRAAVARALAMDPKILLMDEPFGALDVQTRAKLQGFLLQAWRNSGAAVMFVTHDIDEALALADRIFVMTSRPGRIKDIVSVDLSRPRDHRDTRLYTLRTHLIDLLADEVDRAFAEQENTVKANE